MTPETSFNACGALMSLLQEVITENQKLRQHNEQLMTSLANLVQSHSAAQKSKVEAQSGVAHSLQLEPEGTGKLDPCRRAEITTKLHEELPPATPLTRDYAPAGIDPFDNLPRDTF